MFVSNLLVIALWQASAGAQTGISPEKLLEQYVATGDKALLGRCRSAIPDLPQSHRTRLLHARLLLLEGNPSAALEEARKLNREMPDALDPYALIVDAALVIGDVAEAEHAGQWMLNLRPEDARGLTRGAHVREALKDYEGAQQMLVDALARTPYSDAYTRAGIGVSLARINMQLLRPAVALQLLTQIQTFLPEYRPAILLRQELENER
jgi:tetratricopeptide (TPR) repeat protein